jgi:hypothetical protein
MQANRVLLSSLVPAIMRPRPLPGGRGFLASIAISLALALLTVAATDYAGAAESCPNAEPSDATTTRIYLSTEGSDKNNGSPRKPVKSLMAAYRIARASNAAQVEVLIKPGIYYGQSVEWTEPMSREIRFSTFLGPKCHSNAARAIFDGRRNANDTRGTPTFFMRYDSVPTSQSSMIFENLAVRFYKNGVHLGSHSSRNILRNNVFTSIGERFVGGDINDKPSTSVIGIYSSDYNLIVNNGFYRIEGPAQLHAIYVIKSVGSEIRGNTFSNFSTNLSTIKVRNYSLNTVVAGNTFESAGANAVIDAFCSDAEKNDECKNADECPSWNTLVENNTIRFMDKVVEVVVKDNQGCNPANPKPPGARRFIERSNLHR